MRGTKPNTKLTKDAFNVFGSDTCQRRATGEEMDFFWSLRVLRAENECSEGL